MKHSRGSAKKAIAPYFVKMDDRPLRAWAQCMALLSLFNQHARRGATALATQMLENAAAHLELLADHPFFQQPLDPPQQIPPPIYNTSLIRRQRAQATDSDSLRIQTPTVEQLEALFDLPSDPGS